MNLNKEIFRLAIPSIIANITVPFVGMVAIAVVGHIADGQFPTATLIGGISIGSMIFDLLYWNFSFLRLGTGGLTAQAFGRGDTRECANLLVRAEGIALLSAMVIWAIQWFVAQFAVLAVNGSEEVEYLALRYFYVRVWAAPATLSLMAIKGWFIGMQDSISTMLVDITVNVVNIVMSVILALGVHVLGMNYDGVGFIGVALATVIAQYSGFALAAIIVLLKYRHVFESFPLADVVNAFRGDRVRQFFRMNADLMLRSLCFIGIYIGFTTIAASFGDVILATSSIMMQLMLLFSYITDGFAYAGEAMVGKYIGAGDGSKMRTTVRYVFWWSAFVAALFILAYGVYGDAMLGMLTSDADVLSVGSAYIPWLILMPIVGVIAFTWDGIYTGAAATIKLRNSMIFAVASYIIFYFGASFLFNAEKDGIMGLHLLLAAYFVHLLVRTLYLTANYKREILMKQ